MGCCGNRCTVSPINDEDEGDPMKNDTKLGLHGGNTQLGNEMMVM